MATAVEKKLYRSNDAVIAGVCAGIAERFGLDAIAVRILAALLACSTCGLAVGVYFALWFVLPMASSLTPEAVPRAVYIPAPPGSFAQAAQEARNSRKSRIMQRRESFRAEHDRAQEARRSHRRAIEQRHASFRTEDGREVMFVDMPKPPKRDAVREQAPGGWPKFALWSGLTLVALGVSIVLGAISPVASWWQFLPLALCLGGLALVVVPSAHIPRLKRVSLGIVLFFGGVFVLSMSSGVLAWSTASAAFDALWPGLLVAAGLAIISWGIEDDILLVAAALCIAVLCVVAVMCYGELGFAGYVAANSPFGPIRMLRVYL